MKTANNIPVYGNIAVYIKYCPVCLKIDYTLRCLEYIYSVSSRLRHHGLSLRWRPINREVTDKCTLTITCDRAEYDGFLTEGLTRLFNVLHLYIRGPLFTGIGV